MAKIDAFFNLMLEQKASDLHLSSGNPPMLRINGELQRVDYPPLENDDLKAMLYEIAPEYKIKVFEETGDVDFGYEIPERRPLPRQLLQPEATASPRCSARFRARCSPSRISRSSTRRCRRCSRNSPCCTAGWCVVTGPTGSGKSTTLAAMVDYANKNRKDHIITVEDPIEFVHESKSCLVNHREVGVHTQSFAAALRGALREDPDIILVGEMRDLETIELALTAASTGHLVFGTLHTAERRQDRRPHHRRVPRRPAEQDPRHAFGIAARRGGAEPLQARRQARAAWPRWRSSSSPPPIANLVREGKTHQIPGMIQVGKKLGNQPLDDAIMEHLRMKRICAGGGLRQVPRQKEIPAVPDHAAGG